MNKENLSPKNLGLQILDFSDANKTSDPKIVVENQISLKKPSSRRSINCTICDIDLKSNIDFEKHINGKRHLKKTGQANSVPVKNLDIPSTNQKAEDATKRDKTMICDLCQVIAFCQADIDAHMSGKKHLRKIGLSNSIQVQRQNIHK